MTIWFHSIYGLAVVLGVGLFLPLLSFSVTGVVWAFVFWPIIHMAHSRLSVTKKEMACDAS